MKFVLCKKNEYGDNAILDASDNFEDLIKLAKKLVHDDNMENALTMDDKLREWESVYVQLFNDAGDPVDNSFYSGKTSIFHTVTISGEDNVDEYRMEEVSASYKFFIGYNVRKSDEEIWACNPKGQLIENINDQNLQGKSFYYVKKNRQGKVD